MKGTQVLDDLGRFRITTTDNTSVFTIPAAIATDSGMYAVEVNNEKGIKKIISSILFINYFEQCFQK